MSIFTSVGIVILVMLIQALLQLTPGVFAIWYHYALGKNSKNKTLELSGYFTAGVEFVVAIFMIVIYLTTLTIPNDDLANLILAGISIAMSLFVFFKYYRKGRGTELFISRQCANNLYKKARSARKKSDIFVLGVVAYLNELFLTLPLLIILAMQTTFFTTSQQIVFFIMYILAAIMPICIIRNGFLHDKNLADIQKMRVKNKNFYRIFIGFAYITIAILIIVSRIA